MQLIMEDSIIRKFEVVNDIKCKYGMDVKKTQIKTETTKKDFFEKYILSFKLLIYQYTFK